MFGILVMIISSSFALAVVDGQGLVFCDRKGFKLSTIDIDDCELSVIFQLLCTWTEVSPAIFPCNSLPIFRLLWLLFTRALEKFPYDGESIHDEKFTDARSCNSCEVRQGFCYQKSSQQQITLMRHMFPSRSFLLDKSQVRSWETDFYVSPSFHSDHKVGCRGW